MAFPSNGDNHYKAVESESNLLDFKYLIENQLGKKINKIVAFGGTKTKVDNVIHFEDDTTKNISLKNKKNIKSGSFDYVNTSNFDWLNNGFARTLSTYKDYKGSKSIKGYDNLKKAISGDLSNISSDLLTNLFIKNVIEKYTDLSLTIIDEKTNSIFCDVVPTAFKLITDGGKLSLKESTGVKMSYMIEGIDKDGNKVEIGLRIRVHLNNGSSKWLGLVNGSSFLVVKFQQDKVFNIIK